MNNAYYLYDSLTKFRSLTIKTTQVYFIKQVNPVSDADFIQSSVTYSILLQLTFSRSLFLAFFIQQILDLTLLLTVILSNYLI